MNEADGAAGIDVDPGSSGGEDGEERALNSLNERRTVLRGVLADAYEVGTTARVHDVILCRSEWHQNVWDVWVVGEGEKEHTDSINASAFRSVGELESFLEAV